MTNKVRRDALATTPAVAPAGPVLYFTTRGTASIEDRSTSWPSRRHLATLVYDWDGWILTPRLGDGSHGPFSSSEAAFAWWSHQRDALPPSRLTPGAGSWPPGIDEDWAENGK
jgi:hypothetical protein